MATMVYLFLLWTVTKSTIRVRYLLTSPVDEEAKEKNHPT